MVSKPDPVEGAVNNGAELPALFIYLLNLCSKYIVSQFINEAGASPDLADPIGVAAVQIFSKAEFLWRGESLIDIMIAKIRVACPVLFGIRGNDKTDDGRARLGWHKFKQSDFVFDVGIQGNTQAQASGQSNGAEWVSEQVHVSRMTGLGAGYAAISLRDFSKSRLRNPYHPTHYWQSMAGIVLTPPAERSATQYVVLKAMIEGYEQTFMKFYGNAARAALQVALVTFPQQSLETNAAVKALSVLGDKVKKDLALSLQQQ